MKKISVIIPTYRPESYLMECIHSIEKQTLNSLDYEILIILNGEKEPYYTEIEKYIVGKKNHKLYYTEKLGVSNARNIGIKESKNRYLCFIDDDDFISENYLENLLKDSDENSILVSNLLTIKQVDNRYEFGEDYVTRAFKLKTKSESNDLFEMRKFLSNACGKIIPKKIINEVKFDENFKTGEDSLFMCEISKNIKNIRTTGEDTVYYRRIRDNSASRKKRTKNEEIDNCKKLIRKYLKMLMNEKYRKKFIISRIVATMKKYLLSY
ncbi:MAG: glycosyltransferase family 2 protein [Cetobacterium sp.]